MLAKAQQGVSLVVVLIMLLVVALGAAASLQVATSTERLNTNAQQLVLAQQQAEAALRHCEQALTLSDDARASTLQEAKLPVTTLSAPAWVQAASWQAGGIKTVVSNASIPAGAVPPECVVERHILADERQVHVVTARGFGSASARASVVWLQSTLMLTTP